MTEVKLAIADIDDQALYLLSELENKFSISVVALIQAAVRCNEPIKLCIQLDPKKYKVALVDQQQLTKFMINAIEIFQGNTGIRKNDFPNIRHLNDMVCLVIPWSIIEKLLSVHFTTTNLFEEIYVLDKNQKSIIQSVCAQSYANVLRLESNIEWQFAALWLHISSNKNVIPVELKISKENLMIVGFELRRYLSGLAIVEPEKISIKQVVNSNNKKTRDDPCRLEIKAAIPVLLKDGKEINANTVMTYLKRIAGQEGCAITKVADDQVSVWWRSSSGQNEYLDKKNLKNRLYNLSRTNPELFNIDFYKR